MGIHGFFVSTIPEIAPFGIEVTLVDGHVAHQFRLAERVLNRVSECQIASAKLSAMVGFAMIAEVYSRGFGYS
jgi:hypothetical protein